MPIARLLDRAVLSVGGQDAKTFLQGLVTNDMEQVSARRAIYTALLTPQGKVIADFFVKAAAGGGFLIDVRHDLAEDLLKRLKLYRLRAAVDLANESERLCVLAMWEAGGVLEIPGSWQAFIDPRLDALGRRVIAPLGEAHADTSQDAYDRHRVALGVPDTGDVVGAFLLDANGEELHAVDFRKGCYVGQEVTARMKHKAQPRKRLVALDGLPEGTPPGTAVLGVDGTEIGALSSVCGSSGIAALRIDRLSDAGKLMAHGTPVTIVRPAYPMPAIADFAAG